MCFTAKEAINGAKKNCQRFAVDERACTDIRMLTLKMVRLCSDTVGICIIDIVVVVVVVAGAAAALAVCFDEPMSNVNGEVASQHVFYFGTVAAIST